MLAIFDFDHTIVHDNSDIVARNIIHPPNLIPDSREFQNRWTQYMQQVFDTLKNINIPTEQIMDAISLMDPIKGMPELLRALHENNIDIIVASDSNSVFIHNWFEHNKLSDVLLRVYTNLANIEDGRIIIKPYASQTLCDQCPVNMCKGIIVKEHIANINKEYNKLFYFGDGLKDLCPVLQLNQNDIAFPRSGYCLDNLLKTHTTKAIVIPWNTGDDIHEYFKSSKLIC